MKARKRSEDALGLRMTDARKQGKKGAQVRLSRLLKRPPELDLKGLGRRVCEVLGVRSGDTVQFHILTDGSVRIVNYGNKELPASQW